MTVRSPLLPFAVAAGGIAVYSGMDAILKGLSIEAGAYAAVLWRSWTAVTILLPLFVATGARWPRGGALGLHLARGGTAGASVLLFFWGLVRVPMAQGVAITFLAPLIAMALAALTLGERLRRAALLGVGIAAGGVLVIAGGAVQARAAGATVAGTLAIFAASILYAGSLVLQRRQAQVAGPIEVALFTSLVIGSAMLPAAPFVAAWPSLAQAPRVLASALLGTISAVAIAWAYRHAEAQVLAPVEYTAFLWAALLGWWVFGERVSGWTVAGAGLIVAGCAIAVRRTAGAVPAMEAAA